MEKILVKVMLDKSYQEAKKEYGISKKEYLIAKSKAKDYNLEHLSAFLALINMISEVCGSELFTIYYFPNKNRIDIYLFDGEETE